MGYRILVADDETIIRRGIIKLLRKYEDLEVVAEAEDGEQALEISNEMELDILFVDINMPFVNGLQFIEKLKDIQPNAIVNIITGYDKFEYVRQALRLGVFEYILKPLNEQAFDNTIDRIINTLNQRNNEEKYLQWAKSTLGKNRASLIGEFFERSLKLDYSEDKLKDEMKFLGLNIEEQYRMCLFSFERMDSQDLRQRWDDNLISYAAENIALEVYDSVGALFTFYSRGYLTLINNLINPQILEAMDKEYTAAVEKYIPVKATMLCQGGQDYLMMPEYYKELLGRMEEIKAYPSIIKRVKKFITENYHRDDLSLNNAAEYVNLSPQHLSRIFKKEMGITLVDYLTQVRIEKAIELFAQEDIKMYEIAEKVGYTTQHYFSNVFKKVLGISPLDYRNQYKNKKNESFYRC